VSSWAARKVAFLATFVTTSIEQWRIDKGSDKGIDKGL